MAQLTCPQGCGTYPEGWTNCRSCFSVLLPDPAASEPDHAVEVVESNDPTGSSTCPECHGGMLADEDECSHCGAAAQAPPWQACRVHGPWGVVEIGAEPLRIGRSSPDAAVAAALAESDIVSRSHCELVVRDGRTWLRDVGSANGTYLNDRRLEAGDPVAVGAGDTIRLGSSVRLEIGDRRG
jgi:hypothetical protein